MEISKPTSIKVTFGDTEELLDRVYDHVHLFRPLGHSILKLVTDEGFRQWHLPLAQGLNVAEQAGIVPTDRPTINQREYDGYLRFQATQLENWLD